MKYIICLAKMTGMLILMTYLTMYQFALTGLGFIGLYNVNAYVAHYARLCELIGNMAEKVVFIADATFD